MSMSGTAALTDWDLPNLTAEVRERSLAGSASAAASVAVQGRLDIFEKAAPGYAVNFGITANGSGTAGGNASVALDATHFPLALDQVLSQSWRFLFEPELPVKNKNP